MAKQPRTVAKMDGDASGFIAESNKARKSVKKIGKEADSSGSKIGAIAGRLGAVGAAISAATAATKLWNDELQRGQEISRQINDLQSGLAGGGNLAQGDQVRRAINRHLGFNYSDSGDFESGSGARGTLGRDQLTSVFNAFKGKARGADAAAIDVALGQAQELSGTGLGTEDILSVVSAAGTLVNAGMDPSRAMDVAFFMIQNAGDKAGTAINAIAALANMIGAEQAEELIPIVLATVDSETALGQVRSQVFRLAQGGFSGDYASVSSRLLTDNQRQAAVGFRGGSNNFIQRERASSLLNNLEWAEEFEVLRREVALERDGPARARQLAASREDRLQTVIDEERRNYQDTFRGAMGAALIDWSNVSALSIDEESAKRMAQENARAMRSDPVLNAQLEDD